MRALLLTPLTAVAFVVGLTLLLEFGILNALPRDSIGYRALREFQLSGLLPPVNLLVLAGFPKLDADADLPLTSFGPALAGVGFYALLSWLLWRRTRALFRSLTGEGSRE